MAGQDYSAAFAPMMQNPLQAAQGAMALQAQGMQNAAQMQEMKARAALGPILQAAVNPQTGELDYNKAFVAMSANPDTAWKAPEFLDKAVARQLTQKDIALKQLDITQKQQESIYNATTPLLEKGNSLSRMDVMKAAADLYGAGQIDKSHYETFAQNLPPDGAPLFTYAKQLAQRAQGASETLKRTYGDYQSQNELVPFMDENGVQRTVTRKQLQEMQGQQPNQFGAGNMPSAPPAATGAPSAPPTAGAPSAPGAPQQGVGGGAMAPHPQFPAKDLSQVQHLSLQNYEKDLQTFPKITQADASMEQNIDKMEQTLKDFKPGAGQEWRRNVGQVASAMGFPDSIVKGITGSDLPPNQIFRSLAMDLATKMMARTLAGGGRFTNTEFNTYQDMKPNENMTKEAVVSMLQHFRNGIKLDREYMNQLAQAKTGGVDYSQFQNQFNQKLQHLSDLRRAYYQKNPSATANEPGIHPGWSPMTAEESK